MAGGLLEALRAQTRLTVRGKPEEMREFLKEMQRWIEKDQNGSVSRLGLRIEIREAVPTDTPRNTDPRVIIADTGSGPIWYVFVDGTGWVSMATLSAPGIHQLASAVGLGPEHTTTGLTIGHALIAHATDNARFQAITFSLVAGAAVRGQLPAEIAYEDEANSFVGDQDITGDLLVAGDVAITGVLSVDTIEPFAFETVTVNGVPIGPGALADQHVRPRPPFRSLREQTDYLLAQATAAAGLRAVGV